MIYLIATLTAKPGRVDELIAAAAACITATRAEEGCEAYDLYTSVSDPLALVFVEKWASSEAVMSHSRADHMRVFGKVAAECCAAAPRIEIITPQSVDHR